MRGINDLNILINSFYADRRKFIRYDVFAECNIREVSFSVFTLHDISEGGCQVELGKSSTSHKFEKGSIYTLDICPHTISYNRLNLKSFTISAILVWLEQSSKPSRFGFQFIKPEVSEFKNWLSFLDKHHANKKNSGKCLI